MAIIRKIPATVSFYTAAPLTEQRKRKVAAYARVSTDSDEQFTSYEAQIDYYTQYIKARDDWEFIEVYTDEGITGTSTKHREGFKRMVADALAGRIELIVTKSVSRFARNTVDSLTTIRLLKEHGVECYFEKENIWTFDGKGELLITIMSSLAQEESRSISENCTWGQRKRIADGKVSIPFSNMLGFKRGPQGEVLVDQEQAVIVKRIYNMFLNGLSPYAIADRLTQKGIPSPTGKKTWYGDIVRSILTNEKYKGDALLQKSYTIDFLTKKKAVNNGVLQQVYVEGNHEAIIPPETFELVQVELKRRSESKQRYSGVGLYSSRIICGECGSYYGSKVWHSNSDKYKQIIFRCNGKYKNGKARCSTPHVTEEVMQELFVAAVNKLIEKRSEIIEGLRNTAEKMYDTKGLQTEAEQLSDEMNRVSEMMNAAIERNAHTALDQEKYQKEFAALASRFDEAKSEYEKAKVHISEVASTKAAVEQFISTIEGLKCKVQEFNPELWGKLLDHATVYSAEDIRFMFRNGIEI